MRGRGREDLGIGPAGDRLERPLGRVERVVGVRVDQAGEQRPPGALDDRRRPSVRRRRGSWSATDAIRSPSTPRRPASADRVGDAVDQSDVADPGQREPARPLRAARRVLDSAHVPTDLRSRSRARAGRRPRDSLLRRRRSGRRHRHRPSHRRPARSDASRSGRAWSRRPPTRWHVPRMPISRSATTRPRSSNASSRHHGALDEPTAVLVTEMAKLQARTVGGTEDYVVTREFTALATEQQTDPTCCARASPSAPRAGRSRPRSRRSSTRSPRSSTSTPTRVNAGPRRVPRAPVVRAGRPAHRRGSRDRAVARRRPSSRLAALEPRCLAACGGGGGTGSSEPRPARSSSPSRSSRSASRCCSPSPPTSTPPGACSPARTCRASPTGGCPRDGRQRGLQLVAGPERHRVRRA